MAGIVGEYSDGLQQHVRAGDVAMIFNNWDEGSRPGDLGTACGSSVYDLTTHLGRLISRRVL